MKTNTTQPPAAGEAAHTPKHFTDWDFARNGRTLHAWQDLPLQVGQMGKTVCGVTAPKARCRHIHADDKRCEKCIHLEAARITKARAALASVKP